MNTLPILSSHFIIKNEVSQALINSQPVVALESTVITHGLPYPENLALAKGLEQDVALNLATPATIALIKGKIHIGLTDLELEELATSGQGLRKISRRDFGIALARKESGGTTVAGTLIAAHSSKIKVFATGGIGGVHRNAPFDVSADLPELGRTPLVVVCAGAKSILDLPATVEYLETVGVPVIGYQTDEFPAFYSRKSGLPVNVSVQTAQEVAKIAQAHWDLGITSAILVVAPPPVEAALPHEEIDGIIEQALAEAWQKKISGYATTPYLLARISELSGGKSMKTNLALLHNNAAIAAQIAQYLASYNIRNRVI
jgi:pseudouridylate synthase